MIELHLGEIWTCAAGAGKTEFRALPAGALAVDEAGVIFDVCAAGEARRRYPAASIHDHGERLILPGFIDAHLHFPQIDVIGCYGEQLLGWLNKYTFPAEAALADGERARRTARRVIDALLANGTTTAALFSSSHLSATRIFFEEARRRGIRAVIGKTGMDRHAPPEILVPPEREYEENCALIDEWDGRDGRLFCALTPRFAPTSSEQLLAQYRRLREKYPQIYVQTHFAESPAELEWVRQLFPRDASYLAVYDRFNLLGPQTLLAHGIHATEAELARVRESGSVIVHCPAANLFLGSGLLPLAEYRERGIRLALGSDVGAGTTFSPWRLMDEGYKIQQLRGRSVTPAVWFELATLCGAAALGWSELTGSLEPGKQADFQILDWRRGPLLAPRFEQQRDPLERLFALINLADDRLVEAVFVRGCEIYRHENLPQQY